MTWTDTASLSTDANDPITTELMTALKENPEAIANADSGAPSIGPAIAAITPGDVGSFVFAVAPDSVNDDPFGDTLAGSNLQPAGVDFLSQSGAEYTGAQGSADGTVTLSGTWVCLGYSNSNPRFAMTLWMRTV